jgi:hypothetical protein
LLSSGFWCWPTPFAKGHQQALIGCCWLYKRTAQRRESSVNRRATLPDFECARVFKLFDRCKNETDKQPLYEQIDCVKG